MSSRVRYNRSILGKRRDMLYFVFLRFEVQLLKSYACLMFCFHKRSCV